MAQVLTRPLADIDVLEIWNYIAEDSFEAADNWIDELNKRMLLWASQPNMGRERSDLAHGLRSFPFGRYLVFYIPINDGIEVVRIIHSSRDIESSFE